MKCGITKNIPIRVLTNTEKTNDDFLVKKAYLYNEDGIFAACKVDGHIKIWYLIHRPSESLVASFNRKKDLESFLDFLLEIIDEREVRFLTPLWSQINEEIMAAYKVAHIKFWKKAKGWP